MFEAAGVSHDALSIASNEAPASAKRYDVNKPISDETLNDLLEVLRLSPSSVNIQPWHFMP